MPLPTPRTRPPAKLAPIRVPNADPSKRVVRRYDPEDNPEWETATITSGYHFASMATAVRIRGNPRPSATLTELLDPIIYKVNKSSYDSLLETWLAAILFGAEFKREKSSYFTLAKSAATVAQKTGLAKKAGEAAQEGGKAAVDAAPKPNVAEFLGNMGGAPRIDLDSTLEKLRAVPNLNLDRFLDPQIRKDNVSEFLTELGTVIKNELALDLVSAAIPSISDVASIVVSSIPFLGTAVAIVKHIYADIQLGKLAYEAWRVYQAQSTSFSRFEKEVYAGITFYQKIEGAFLGEKAMATGAIAVGSAVPGAGGIIEIGHKIVEQIMKIAVEIIHIYIMWKTNKILALGTVTSLKLDDLGNCPLLRLHLPHMEGVGPLTMLGVLPPGWQDMNAAAEINNRLAEIQVKGTFGIIDLVWLTAGLIGDPTDPVAMRQGAAQAAKTTENPWKPEYERIVLMLERTNKYIYKQNIRLWQDGLILYDPTPEDFSDKAKTAAISLVKGVFTTRPPSRVRPLSANPPS